MPPQNGWPYCCCQDATSRMATSFSRCATDTPVGFFSSESCCRDPDGSDLPKPCAASSSFQLVGEKDLEVTLQCLFSQPCDHSRLSNHACLFACLLALSVLLSHLPLSPATCFASIVSLWRFPLYLFNLIPGCFRWLSSCRPLPINPVHTATVCPRRKGGYIYGWKDGRE